MVEILTVDQVADRLRERIAIEGARKSYEASGLQCGDAP